MENPTKQLLQAKNLALNLQLAESEKKALEVFLGKCKEEVSKKLEDVTDAVKSLRNRMRRSLCQNTKSEFKSYDEYTNTIGPYFWNAFDYQKIQFEIFIYKVFTLQDQETMKTLKTDLYNPVIENHPLIMDTYDLPTTGDPAVMDDTSERKYGEQILQYLRYKLVYVYDLVTGNRNAINRFPDNHETLLTAVQTSQTDANMNAYAQGFGANADEQNKNVAFIINPLFIRFDNPNPAGALQTILPNDMSRAEKLWHCKKLLFLLTAPGNESFLTDKYNKRQPVQNIREFYDFLEANYTGADLAQNTDVGYYAFRNDFLRDRLQQVYTRFSGKKVRVDIAGVFFTPITGGTANDDVVRIEKAMSPNLLPYLQSGVNVIFDKTDTLGSVNNNGYITGPPMNTFLQRFQDMSVRCLREFSYKTRLQHLYLTLTGKIVGLDDLNRITYNDLYPCSDMGGSLVDKIKLIDVDFINDYSNYNKSVFNKNMNFFQFVNGIAKLNVTDIDAKYEEMKVNYLFSSSYPTINTTAFVDNTTTLTRLLENIKLDGTNLANDVDKSIPAKFRIRAFHHITIQAPANANRDYFNNDKDGFRRAIDANTDTYAKTTYLYLMLSGQRPPTEFNDTDFRDDINVDGTDVSGEDRRETISYISLDYIQNLPNAQKITAVNLTDKNTFSEWIAIQHNNNFESIKLHYWRNHWAKMYRLYHNGNPDEAQLEAKVVFTNNDALRKWMLLSPVVIDELIKLPAGALNVGNTFNEFYDNYIAEDVANITKIFLASYIKSIYESYTGTNFVYDAAAMDGTFNAVNDLDLLQKWTRFGLIDVYLNAEGADDAKNFQANPNMDSQEFLQKFANNINGLGAIPPATTNSLSCCFPRFI